MGARHRVPLVEGEAMDFGRGGRLLVCDATGTYLVDNRKSVLRLQKPEAIKDEGVPSPPPPPGGCSPVLLRLVDRTALEF